MNYSSTLSGFVFTWRISSVSRLVLHNCDSLDSNYIVTFQFIVSFIAFTVVISSHAFHSKTSFSPKTDVCLFSPRCVKSAPLIKSAPSETSVWLLQLTVPLFHRYHLHHCQCWHTKQLWDSRLFFGCTLLDFSFDVFKEGRDSVWHHHLNKQMWRTKLCQTWLGLLYWTGSDINHFIVL